MSIRRSLEGAALALLLVAGSVSAAETEAAQRARIERERAAVLAQGRVAERECAQRFVVSQCLAQVREERRSALQQLDHQKALLDDAQRKRRAAERQARINQRQQEQARADEQRLAPGTTRPPARDAASAPVTSAKAASAPTKRRTMSTAQTDASAARRAEASKRRVEEATAHREAVEQRNRERAAQRPPQAPLPVPPRASAPTR
jgi:colicin import membrane protein